MRDGAQETVGIRWEVYPRSSSFQIKNSADERGVLMGESIMFLARPGAGFEVVDRGVGCSEGCFACHFDELAVLDHHSVGDADEGFVGGE